MRATRFFAAGLLFFLILIPGRLPALELRLFGGAGNLAFDPAAEEALSDTAGRFEPHLYPWGQISLAGKFSDMTDFRASYERDPLLGNRIVANVGIQFNAIRVDFGPFISPFNTKEQPISTGIAAALGFEFPGILFGSIQAASTIGSLATLPGEYVQQTGELSLGFWVPYVVCAFSINTKSFTQRKSDELLIKDDHIRYQFRADVFTKNVPYTVYIDMGFQSLKRSYIPSQAESVTDELKSIYIGFEGSYRIVPAFRLVLGMEMPVYAWGEQPLKSPEKNAVLYQVQG
ncbi:MAG: hypothetical protein LBL28_01055, partial [Treponema sp.]|nr:hypothetical protein [Treponema sp.]